MNDIPCSTAAPEREAVRQMIGIETYERWKRQQERYERWTRHLTLGLQLLFALRNRGPQADLVGYAS